MITLKNINQMLILAGWIALLLSIFAAPMSPVWDETWYLVNTSELLEKGMGLRYLREFNVSTGPIFAFIHAIPYALSDGSLLVARLVNFGLIAIVPCLLCALRPPTCSGNAIVTSAVFVSVPFLWPAMGLAMTEALSLVFIVSSFLFARSGTLRHGVSSYYFAIAAGLALAIAGLTRQTSLAALPAVGWLIWHNGANKALSLSLFIFTAFAPLALLFIAWGGPIAPNLTSVGGSSLSVAHAILSFAYVGVAIAIINYRFLALTWSSRYTILLGGVLLLLLFLLLSPNYLPASSIVRRLTGNEIPDWVVSILIRGGLACLASLAITSLLVRLWHDRASTLNVSLLVAAICLCASAAAVVSQFSSRYAVLSVPFLSLSVAGDGFTDDKITTIVRLFGIVGGFTIFWNYCSI